MAKSKKPQKKIPKNKAFSSRDNLILYFEGEKREFKSTTEFCKETGISGAIVKDWLQGSLIFSFKGWHIDQTKSMESKPRQ